MRVKLSYTVESEDVLKEAAKMMGLSSDDMKQAIDLFQAIPAELSRADDEDPPNVPKALDMIDELRKALLAVDTRLLEVADIVEAYDRYRADQRHDDSAPLGSQEEAPEVQ